MAKADTLAPAPHAEGETAFDRDDFRLDATPTATWYDFDALKPSPESYNATNAFYLRPLSRNQFGQVHGALPEEALVYLSASRSHVRSANERLGLQLLNPVRGEGRGDEELGGSADPCVVDVPSFERCQEVCALLEARKAPMRAYLTAQRARYQSIIDSPTANPDKKDFADEQLGRVNALLQRLDLRYDPARLFRLLVDVQERQADEDVPLEIKRGIAKLRKAQQWRSLKQSIQVAD